MSVEDVEKLSTDDVDNMIFHVDIYEVCGKPAITHIDEIKGSKRVGANKLSTAIVDNRVKKCVEVGFFCECVVGGVPILATALTEEPINKTACALVAWYASVPEYHRCAVIRQYSMLEQSIFQRDVELHHLTLLDTSPEALH